MNLTAKSRYALKIMMDLAAHQAEGHQQRHNIANRQSIPVDFMDQITARLRAGGLIESIRGRSGGFHLAKSSTDISLWDIFQAVEDSLYPVKCLDHETCELEESCISVGAWRDVSLLVRAALSEKTLADSVEKWQMLAVKRAPKTLPSNSTTCNRPHFDRTPG